jgi:DnaJ family protein C protein 27
MAGEDVYFNIRNEFYQDTDGVLLVFDVQSKQSFQRLEKWLEEMASCLNKQKAELFMDAHFILIGNKVSHYKCGSTC